jgi:RloB-like protein
MASIKPYIRIVCEGKNTEPKYLKAYLKDRNMDSTEAVRKPKDHSPLGIAKEVTEQLKEARKSKIPPENIYIFGVFDKDGHANVPNAIHKIEALAKKYPAAKIGFAFSNPCFEFWILLHFVYTSKPFAECDDAGDEVKKMLPTYDKTAQNIDIFIPELLKKIPDAIKNARKSITKHWQLNPENSLYDPSGIAIWDLNPYTNFHLLLENLP